METEGWAWGRAFNIIFSHSHDSSWWAGSNANQSHDTAAPKRPSITVHLELSWSLRRRHSKAGLTDFFSMQEHHVPKFSCKNSMCVFKNTAERIIEPPRLFISITTDFYLGVIFHLYSHNPWFPWYLNIYWSVCFNGFVGISVRLGALEWRAFFHTV